MQKITSSTRNFSCYTISYPQKREKKTERKNQVVGIKQNLNFVHKYSIIDWYITPISNILFFLQMLTQMLQSVFLFWLATIWKHLALFSVFPKNDFFRYMSYFSVIKTCNFTRVLRYLYNLCNKLWSIL